MKKIFTLLAVLSLCQTVAFGQKKYEMVVEKTDGTETVIKVEDIVRTYFRERTDIGGEGDNFLVGEWQECNFAGTFKNDATDWEVHHMKVISNEKAEWWTVTKGKKDSHWYSFDYTYTLNGSSGTLSMTITSSSNPSEVGQSATAPITYENGILHGGEIYYKKIGGTDSGPNEDVGGYTSCPDANHPHMINLGLPSGTLWACCNVGATTPEGYGNYYAWGEAQPKSVYSESTYQYYQNGNYVNLGYEIAGTGYDTATANWGAPWRMPLEGQCEELLESCTSEWTTQNGVNGRKFTGPNGGTIFLPAAGSWVDNKLNYAGSYGTYWSSSSEGASGAGELYFSSGYANTGFGTRYVGHSVRPVQRN